MACTYSVPVAIPPVFHQTEQVIRKSRFLAQGCRCASRGEARAVVAGIRSLYPEATHHCWAYVAGAPGCTTDVGSSDDGEPHGTAGRPMLNALLHCGIGQICVVISRWFGGIKLGTGGLSRAYRDGVLENTAAMPVELAQTLQCWRLSCAYADLDSVKRLLGNFAALVDDEKYDENVTLIFRLPEEQGAEVVGAIRGITAGRGEILPLLSQ